MRRTNQKQKSAMGVEQYYGHSRVVLNLQHSDVDISNDVQFQNYNTPIHK